MPPRTNCIPSTKRLNIPVTDEILFISPFIPEIILGKFCIAQPINNTPTKSNILPRNPLVLFVNIFP